MTPDAFALVYLVIGVSVGVEVDALGASSKPWPKEIPEPSICGMPDGIPSRVDSLRGLGNAVVPIQAREAFKRLVGLSLRRRGEARE